MARYHITPQHCQDLAYVGELLEIEGKYIRKAEPLAVPSDYANITIEGVTLADYLQGTGKWLKNHTITSGRATEQNCSDLSVVSLGYYVESEHVKHAYPDLATHDKRMKLHELLLAISAKIRQIVDEISGNGNG